VPPSRAFARIIASFVLLAPRLAGAQEPGESIDVVGQRLPQSARAPAVQATVVDAAEYGGEVRSVGELLLAAPGVTVHPLGGPGQPATLSLRGASADQSLVLLDGIPLQGAGGGAVDLSALPATLLSRMVVSRGVLGAQYGAGALGGAVELLPKSARDRTEAGALVSGGSFATARAAADVSAGGALVAVQGDHTAGDFDYARQLTPDIPDSPYYGFTRNNADATRGSALARLAQPLSATTEIDLLLQGSAGDRGLPGPANAPTALSRERDLGGLLGARLTGSAGDATWAVRSWGRADRVELLGVQPFGDCLDGTPGCSRSDERYSTARAEAEMGAPVGSSQWTHLSVSGGGEWIGGTGTGSHRRGLVSAAASDDIDLPAGFAAHPAARLDAIGRDVGVSPAFTAAWSPRQGSPLSLRAGWGLSFRAPTFNELFLQSGGIAPNPDLRPERAWSVDAGISWRAPRVQLSASAFYSGYAQLILYELNPSANQVKPFNIGTARIWGFELEAVLPLPAGFAAEAAYSFLHATNDAGQDLPYRPPHRLFARLARTGDRLEGYAESSFTSAMPRNSFDVRLATQLVFNAGAGVRAAGPLWIDLEVKNLLDDQTLEDLFQYPLPGRSIAVVARARL